MSAAHERVAMLQANYEAVVAMLGEVEARTKGAIKLEERVETLDDGLVRQLKALEKKKAAEAHLGGEGGR